MFFSQKKSLVGVALAIWAFVCSAQVKSGAYQLMLKGLLSHSVPEIGVQEAARECNSIFFLDAREPREFEVSHINGALSVGYDHFEVQKLPFLDKNQRIVVYCSVGYRSEKVAEKLRAAGFQNVANLYGGIFEWVNQGFKIVNEQGNTDEVHAFSRSWGVWLKRGKKVYR
jgi:rhodanese-related sulfurtransferase